MESINLDLESESHKTIDLPLNDKPKPQGINIQKSESNIGMELLMNKKKTSSDNISSLKPQNSQDNTKSINLDTNNNNGPDEGIVDLDNLLSSNSNDLTSSIKDSNNDLKDIGLDNLDLNLDSLDNLDSVDINNKPSTTSDNTTSNNFFSAPAEEPVINKPKTYEELQKEKFELLCQLERLEAKGIRLEKKYNMQSDYDEMKHEFDRLNNRRELDQSVRFQQKMLVAAVTAIEFLNNRFDPFDVKLDGWSENVHESVHDYDDIFEELHEKYKEKSKMAPELRLLMMLGGSAFMFHLTNSMFKSSLPGMGDIMKQNPDLMQQFAKATVNSMGPQEPGFSDLMNGMINTQGPKPSRNTGPQRQPQGPSRPEMKPPPDLNTILSEISTSNSPTSNLDLSDLSESDSDVKNLNINLGKKSNKHEINLEL